MSKLLLVLTLFLSRVTARPFVSPDPTISVVDSTALDEEASTPLNGTMFVDGVPLFTDVHAPDSIGDCWLTATIPAIALSQPTKILNILQPLGYTWSVKLVKPNGQSEAYPLIQNRIPQANGVAAAPDWPRAIQDAFVLYASKNIAEYPSNLSGSFPTEAFDVIYGEGSSSTFEKTDNMSDAALVTAIWNNVPRLPTVACTNENDLGLPVNHAYTVISWDPVNKDITLRNPWGYVGSTHPALRIPQPDTGVFTVSWADWKRHFGCGIFQLRPTSL